MNLLLVNVINPGRPIDRYLPNLGLAYLASFLKKHIPSLGIEMVDHDVSDFITINRPDLVGISVCSPNFGRIPELVNLCQDLGIPVILGGIHISMLPYSLPRGVTAGVIGEGEQTFLEIIGRFQNEKLSIENLRQIDGTVFYNEKGEIECSKNRSLIHPLDRLPFPDRSLLEGSLPGIRRENIHMFSSRGCPYRCVFCASSIFWGMQRYFSPKYIVEELKTVIDSYHPQIISFWDDLFIYPLKRFDHIVELICEHDIHKRVQFAVQCRANLVNKRVAVLLKRMNVSTVNMGLESGCQKTLDYLKGGVTVEQNGQAIDLLVDQHIRVTGGFIIGSPHETEEDVEETFKFIEKSKLFHFDIFLLTPYPGTPVWDYAIKRGIVSGMDVNLEHLRSLDMSEVFDENSLILSEKLSRADLLRLFKSFEALRIRRQCGNKTIKQRIKGIGKLGLEKLETFCKGRSTA